MSLRVTSGMFTDQLKFQINQSLTSQYDIQKKIASGLAFTQASDNPVGFDLLKQQFTQQSQNTGYLNATSEASNEATFNANAMTDLQNVMSRAAELATSGVSTALGPEGLHALGTEMNTLIGQIQAIANRSNNGYYAFGGTQNLPPIDGTSNPGPGYNSAVTNNNVKTIQIAPNSTPVNVQIFAGSVKYAALSDPETNPAFPTTAVTPNVGVPSGTAMNGFLVKGGPTGQSVGTDPNTGGVDILGFIRNAAATLQSGKPITTDQLDNLVRASNYVSESVGKTTAVEAQFTLNQQALTNIHNTQEIDISQSSSANTAGLATDLSSMQTAYQGSLASGAKILQMSLLQYLQ